MSKKTLAPSDIADKFMLRLPNGMRNQIAEEAAKNKRSMNAEIVARLEASLSDSKMAFEPGGRRIDEILYEMIAERAKDGDDDIRFEIRPIFKKASKKN